MTYIQTDRRMQYNRKEIVYGIALIRIYKLSFSNDCYRADCLNTHNKFMSLSVFHG